MKQSAKNVGWILGCIAAATAPIAMLDLVKESGCKAPFKDLLSSIELYPKTTSFKTHYFFRLYVPVRQERL